MSRAGLVLALLALLAGVCRPAQDATAAQLVSQYLESKDYSSRRKLQTAVQELGAEGADATLRALAEDREVAQRRMLVGLLAGITAPGVARELGALVRDERDSSMRSSAILGLAKHGAEGFEVLADLIKLDLDVYSRARVAETLVRVGRPEVTGLLVSALRKDLREDGGSDLVRVLVHHDPEAAVQLFPKMLSQASERNQARMVKYLATLLPQVPESRRKPIVAALRSARSRLVRSLATAQTLELRETAHALGALGDPIAVRPLRSIHEERPDEAVLWALARIDPAGSRDLFLDVLQREESAARRTLTPTALRGLARIGDPELVPLFLHWLDCGATEPAKAAIEGLLRLDARQAAPDLAEQLLRGTPEAALKVLLLEALIAFPDEEVVYPLARAIGEESSSNRTLALQALCAIPGPAATAELIRLSGDQKVVGANRGMVLASLATRTGAAIPALLVAGVTSTATQQAVRDAMREPEALTHLDALLDLLHGLPLGSDLTTADRAQAVALCHLLGDLGEPAAVEALELRIGAKDTGLFVAAYRAWTNCGSDGQVPDQGLAALFVPRLEEVVSQEGLALDLRVDALRLLARLDADATRACIRRILDVPEAKLFSTALDLLGVLGATAEDRPRLLALLGASRTMPDARLLDALVDLGDADVDETVLAQLTARGPAGPLAAEVYALRCGAKTTTRDLEAALATSYPLFRDPDHVAHWQAHLVGGWLTGVPPAPKSCTHPGVVSATYEIKGLEVALPFLPPGWKLEHWVAEHQSELLDDATFAAAVRSPRMEALLKTYLRKYPQGRHAQQAQQHLATLDG